MSVIPKHFSKEHIRSLQMALNELTISHLVVDGDFGNKSILALKLYQTKQKLAVTGIYDAPTQALLEPFIKEKYLTDQDYYDAAQVLGCSVAAVRTVVQVEAAGDGFLDSGSCDILFERHKFWRELMKRKMPGEIPVLRKQYPQIVNPDRGGYLGGQKEWGRLTTAVAIDRDAAYRSTSWGLGQIMGFNHVAAGYPDLLKFVADMQKNERLQLKAFVNFIKYHPAMRSALINGKWVAFAEAYNGPAYADNKYDIKLANAFREFSEEEKKVA